MAKYYGNYTGDNGKIYQRIIFNIYKVQVTVGTRGTRIETSEDDDKTLLPSMYFEDALSFVPRLGYCEVPFSLRYCLLWLGSSIYLHVPIPYQPNSDRYDDFITALRYDFDAKYTDIGIEGEFISPEWLERFAFYG